MLRYENETDEDFKKRLMKDIRLIMEEEIKKHLFVSTKEEFVDHVLKTLEKHLRKREENDR